MCTVSIISTPAGYRVVHNRDELRARPPGELPQWHESAAGVRAIYPTDPASGGTWFAITAGGLCLCILNRNPEPPPTRDPGWLSRGRIIGPLLACRSPGDAIALHRRTWTHLCAPYRLIAIGQSPGRGVSVIELLGEPGREMVVTEHASPCCFASSGLGDSVVHGRLPLFDELVAPDPSPCAQDAYHHHQWPDRTKESVLMTRPDARTVSITIGEVGVSTEPTMLYEPIC